MWNNLFNIAFCLNDFEKADEWIENSESLQIEFGNQELEYINYYLAIICKFELGIFVKHKYLDNIFRTLLLKLKGLNQDKNLIFVEINKYLKEILHLKPNDKKIREITTRYADVIKVHFDKFKTYKDADLILVWVLSKMYDCTVESAFSKIDELLPENISK